MLEEVKTRGDLVAAHRPNERAAYIEGTVQRVYQDGNDFYYEIAWEDGKHFGEPFYEGELDEIDLAESEATIRAAMSEFLSDDALNEWFDKPNGKLRGLSPHDALATLGLKRVAAVAIDDYTDALRDEIEPEADPLESQLRDLSS